MPAAKMPATSERRSSGVKKDGSSIGRMGHLLGSCPQRPSLGDRRAVWHDRMVNSLYLLTYPVRGRGDENGCTASGMGGVWDDCPRGAKLACVLAPMAPAASLRKSEGMPCLRSPGSAVYPVRQPPIPGLTRSAKLIRDVT